MILTIEERIFLAVRQHWSMMQSIDSVHVREMQVRSCMPVGWERHSQNENCPEHSGIGQLRSRQSGLA